MPTYAVVGGITNNPQCYPTQVAQMRTDDVTLDAVVGVITNNLHIDGLKVREAFREDTNRGVSVVRDDTHHGVYTHPGFAG